MPFLNLPPNQLPALDRSLSELLAACEERARALPPAPPSQTLQPDLLDFSQLNRLLAPIELLRPSAGPQQQPSVAAVGGARPVTLSTQDEIVAKTVEKQMQQVRKEYDEDVDRAMDALWQDVRSEFLPGAPAAPAAAPATAVVTSQPVVIQEETGKMAKLYSITFELDASKNRMEELRKTSSNRDVAEMWSLVELLTTSSAAVGTDDGLARARLGKQFLERQYRQVQEQAFGLPRAGGDLRAALRRTRVKNDVHALAFLLCRAGEYVQAVEELRASGGGDAALAEYIAAASGQATQQQTQQEAAGAAKFAAQTKSVFHLALENLGNFHYDADSTVVASVEDFLWFRLSAITNAGEEQLARKRLAELVADLVQRGPEYFTQCKVNPFFYARLLFCCGELERAIDYLSAAATGEFDCMAEAMHFAIHLQSVTRRDESKLALAYSKRFPSNAAAKAMAYLSYYSGFDRNECKRLLVRHATATATAAQASGNEAVLAALYRNAGEQETCAIALRAAAEIKPELAVALLTAMSKLCKEGDALELRTSLVHLVLRELCRVLPTTTASQERLFWRREAEALLQGREQDIPGLTSLRQALHCLTFYDLAAVGGGKEQDEDAAVRELDWLVPTGSTGSASLQTYVARFQTLDRALVDLFPGLVRTLLQLIDLAHFRRGKQAEAKQRLRLLVAFIARLREERYVLQQDVERELAVMESRICI